MLNWRKNLKFSKKRSSRIMSVKIINLKKTIITFAILGSIIFTGTASLMHHNTVKSSISSSASQHVSRNIPVANFNLQTPELDLPIKSAILIEANSGQILYERNSHEKLPPASITKIMTMLLVCEAVESGKLSMDEMVSCSEHANSMGGSQVFLAANERMSVHDMLKSVAVVSANDCAVALGEKIAGSEEAFVGLMNERAKQLGMNDTHFITCSGLDADEHYTSAYDISVMSQELMKHEIIKPFFTIWMDSIRDGKFMLSNTNRLIRFYEGATGIKTGSTSKAGYCLSGSATRNGLSLIAVVMGADSTNNRFESCKRLLDFGFSNYASIDDTQDASQIYKVKVLKGESPEISLKISGKGRLLVPKAKKNLIAKEVNIPEFVRAPIRVGQKIGEVIYKIGDEEICKLDLEATVDVKKIGFGKSLINIFANWLK